jgi:hypothetical protein
MLISLSESSNFRYIRINPATNHVHLRVSFIEGEDISTTNTCKVDERLQVFFEGDAVRELDTYKSTLELHISLLENDDPLCQAKKARLEQINTYLAEVLAMRKNYKDVVDQFLSKPCNLYSVQLRPGAQDSMSRVVNPVFTINRGNDRRGTPLSSLYNEMQRAFSHLNLRHTDLAIKVLNTLPKKATFGEIKSGLKQQCLEQFNQFGIDIDFENYFRRSFGEANIKKHVNKAHVDIVMAFDSDTTPGEYIDALLDMCAPNLWALVLGSPFYLGTSSDMAVTTERLSITTQFYLAIVNIYCRIKGISDKNFGVILDNNANLSQQLVEMISQALTRGDDVEQAIIIFFNAHQKAFSLSRGLSIEDKNTIQQKFDLTYRTVTATNENQHKDDFMVLDREASSENAPFETHEGVIYTNFAHIAPTTAPNQHYFSEIRNEAIHHSELMTPQDEPVITIDIAPVALMDKLDDVQLERLPKEVTDACRAFPAFKVRELLDNVAKGKQDEANAILQSPNDIQMLLRTPGKFTDYSGRTFRCTAYEYAYWAKDTHMQRMLESHMDDETKAFLLGQINKIERSGLAYQQHGVSYKNPHYDMSFALRNLRPGEFRQLKTLVGRGSLKIQQATVIDYHDISFTATEYEALKKILQQHRPKGIFSFFYTSPAEAISEKLQFDFHSVITALDTYVTNFPKWNFRQREEVWRKVGKAQRDVPAHIAHEYCRPDRSFNPLPSFTEETLPRTLTFYSYITINTESWYPLLPASGLGFDFALIRSDRPLHAPVWAGAVDDNLYADLAAIRHLDEVRIADLTQSRENLSRPTNQLELVH